MAGSIEFVRGKNVVASIAFQQSVIYPTDASPGQQPEHLVASDPLGHFHKVHHFAGNPDGTYEPDSWENRPSRILKSPPVRVLLPPTAPDRREL
jgi:hypothetical protein